MARAFLLGLRALCFAFLDYLASNAGDGSSAFAYNACFLIWLQNVVIELVQTGKRSLTNKALTTGQYTASMSRNEIWDKATSNISLYALNSSLDSLSMALKS